MGGRRENGRVRVHAGLAFDQYEQEDVVMLDYDESDGVRSQGLKVVDRAPVSLKAVVGALSPIQAMPQGDKRTRATQEFVAKYGDRAGGAIRVFVGRDTSADAVLDLKDGRGRTRLGISMDSSGVRRIDVLDTLGHIEKAILPVKHGKG